MGKRSQPWLLPTITVLVAISVALYFCNDGRLASNSFPFQQIWNTDLNGAFGPVEGLSTNGGQTIFARTTGKLYALDVMTGKVVWEHDLTAQAVPKPAIAVNGVVFIADGKGIWALNEVDGSVIWHQAPSSRQVYLKSVSDDLVIAVDGGATLYAYDSTSGALLWIEGVCRSTVQPHIGNMYVYVPCFGIRAIKKASGETEWKVNQARRIKEVAYLGDAIFYSPAESVVSAFDLSTRSELWKTSIPRENFREFTVLRDHLVVTDLGQVCSLQRETGNRAWCINFDKPQNPVVVGNTLFVFNLFQNKITALDFNTGSRVGELAIRRLKLFRDDRILMVSVGSLLVFGQGHEVFAFGECSQDEISLLNGKS